MHTHMKIIILMSLSVIISSCSLIEEKDFGSQSQRLEKLSAENRVIEKVYEKVSVKSHARDILNDFV